MFFEFFVEVCSVEPPIVGSVKPEDGLDLREGRLFGAWRTHAPVKDTVIAKLFVAGFPAFHGSIRNSDDVGSFNPEDFSGSGLENNFLDFHSLHRSGHRVSRHKAS